MAYQKPELIDGGPMGDTVEDGIMKTDINVDDIYAALNDLLSQVPDDLDPNAYYRVDGSNQLTANFQAGNFILRNVAPPLIDSDAATQGWTSAHYLPLIGGTVTGPILYATAPINEHELANKAYVDASGGGGGEGEWGSITGDITQQGDLMAEFGKKADSGHLHLDASETVAGFMSAADKGRFDDMSDPALLEEFKAFSGGSPDAGMPIKLDDYGVLDVSFFSIRIFNLIGDWTPTSAQEYPTPADPGDYWVIEGVGDLASGGYTFTTGKLSGKTIYDNELMVKGRDDKWGIIHLKIDPNLYYRLDGSNHLTADFQAGGHKLSALANPTVAQDAATMGWSDGRFLPLTGGTISGLISCATAPASDNDLVNKAYADSSGGSSWEDTRRMELGSNVSDDGACRIDFHSTASPTDYSMTVFRNSGVSGDAGISNTGGGAMRFESGGNFYYNSSRVWTDDYHQLPSPIDADLLGGLAPDAYARLAYLNQFAKGCVRIGPDDTDGFNVWRTRYQGVNIYMGTANGGALGWGNYISSTSGDSPGAAAKILRVVSDLGPDTSGVCNLGEVDHPWKELFTTVAPYTVADETKVRAVATISGLDADFILALTPKAFEVTPNGISNHPFLADVPAPATAKTQLGFIAQDVEAAMTAAGYNPDDYALTTGPAGHKFINQTELIPLLVKKIQDLETRIATLEAP